MAGITSVFSQFINGIYCIDPALREAHDTGYPASKNLNYAREFMSTQDSDKTCH
jgi:hypothetical protein